MSGFIHQQPYLTENMIKTRICTKNIFTKNNSNRACKSEMKYRALALNALNGVPFASEDSVVAEIRHDTSSTKIEKLDQVQRLFN